MVDPDRVIARAMAGMVATRYPALLALRKAQPVFRRRRFLAGSAGAVELGWFTPAGDAMNRGRLVLVNGWWEPLVFTVPVTRDGLSRQTEANTYDPATSAAAASRIAATIISLAYCLIYLAFLPFHAWALALLAGVSALTAEVIGRPGDAITAAITTTVVLVVAAVSPQGGWEQPTLRLADTAIGAAVGLTAAWLTQRVIRPRSSRMDLMAR